MIEKIAEENKFMPIVAFDKINEIVDKFNELRAQLEPLEAVIKDDGTVVWRERSVSDL